MLDFDNDCAINQGKKYFCKYVSADTARKILTDLTGKWSSPLIFNDPFDMQTEIKMDFNDEDLEEPLINEIIRLGYYDKHIVLENDSFGGDLIRSIRTNLQRMPPEEMRRVLRTPPGPDLAKIRENWEEYKNWWQKRVIDIRVFCVVEKHTNLVMWAHYADKHKGAVIRIKLIPEQDTILCAALPVIYARRIPIVASMKEYIQHLTGQKTLDVNKINKRYFCTKSIHWKYEHEWRCFTESSGTSHGKLCDFFPFLPEEIDTIYLGCRMEDTEKENIMRCLAGSLSHTQVYQAKKSTTKFGLDFDRIR